MWAHTFLYYYYYTIKVMPISVLKMIPTTKQFTFNTFQNNGGHSIPYVNIFCYWPGLLKICCEKFQLAHANKTNIMTEYTRRYDIMFSIVSLNFLVLYLILKRFNQNNAIMNFSTHIHTHEKIWMKLNCLINVFTPFFPAWCWFYILNAKDFCLNQFVGCARASSWSPFVKHNNAWQWK